MKLDEVKKEIFENEDFKEVIKLLTDEQKEIFVAEYTKLIENFYNNILEPLQKNKSE